MLVAHDGAGVAAALDALSPARAVEIGRNARRRILGEHTYAHRAAQLEQLLEAGAVTAQSAGAGA